MKTVIIENKEQVEEIISRCDICFVGITDLEGNPYVIPMNFGYQDGVIYLHSGPTGSSIDMLARNNRVCITFSVEPTNRYFSIPKWHAVTGCGPRV